jgi:hypothetical protein
MSDFRPKKIINNARVAERDSEEEPPFEVPSFSSLHDLFRPPNWVLGLEASEDTIDDDVVDENKIALPNWISCVDVDSSASDIDPVAAAQIRQSAFNIMKCYSPSDLKQVLYSRKVTNK